MLGMIQLSGRPSGPANGGGNDNPPSPPGGTHPMLVATGTNFGSQQELVPLGFNTTAGIGAAVGSSFSLAGIGYAGQIFGPYPLYAPGLMFLSCQDNNASPPDGTLIAFALDASTGLTKLTGEVVFSTTDANQTWPPALAMAADGKVYGFASDSTGLFAVKAMEVSGSTLAQVGNTLTGDLPNTGPSKAARVLDGHFCVAQGDANDGTGHVELHAYAFDGADWTAGAVLDLDGSYATFFGRPGCLIGIRSVGRIIDVFTYTAAGGFVLAWSLDPATLSATYDQPEMWLLDEATGFLWFGLADIDYLTGAFYVLEPNFGTAQFDLVASLEDIGQHRLYALALYGDVLFCNDVDYNGTYAHLRSGNALADALPGGLGSYDSLVPLPLLEA